MENANGEGRSTGGLHDLTGSARLVRASEDGDLNEVKRLVEVQGVDVSWSDENDDTPLHWASLYGHLSVVKYLVEKGNCDLERRNKYESTPLHCAAAGGRLNVVHYLVGERGRDPMCGGMHGRTPFHCAYELKENLSDRTQQGRLEVLDYMYKTLLDRMSAICQDGASPLHIAAKCESLAVVQYMIEEKQCDVECRDQNENSLLHYAAGNGRLDILQYLIGKRGCDPMWRSLDCKIPLHNACENGNLDVVKYLIDDLKVDSSCRDAIGMTPLHCAASRGNLTVVRLLVEDCMCDPSVRNKHGQTPADVAKVDCTHITSYLSSTEKIVSSDLRRALVSQLKPYTRKATPTGRELGSGTYGSVIELKSAGETVAGKVFKISSTAKMQAVSSKVCGELIMMTQLRHPNIVQCKGVTLLIDQHMPVLLMEQLESNLHAYLLHPDNANLPMEVKISILYDTANGLKYLHERTPTIIHRDLTAKNVLLLHLEHSKLRAKLADFGNARIVDLDPESSPEQLSSIPGTLEYMPPEAHGEKVTYGPSLDVFSFGHLALFTITQTLVRPLPPTYYDTSTGEIHGRSEVKRRANFDEAEQLSSVNSSIVKLIKQCLHNFPAQRPHTGELLTKLQKMMDPVEETDKSLEKRTSVAGRDTDCKPHLTNLMRLPVLTGDIKIMEESAVKYSDIGTILLKDDHGVRVDTVTEASKGDPVKAIRMIYARWIREDVDCSWLKLTQCLKDCDLNSLANRIEQHFGLSSPQLSPKVLSDVTLHTREQDITSPSKARGEERVLRQRVVSQEQSPSHGTHQEGILEHTASEQEVPARHAGGDLHCGGIILTCIIAMACTGIVVISFHLLS